MNALAQVIETLSLEMDFEKVCRAATRIAMEMIGADVCALALPAGDDTLSYQYFWGLPENADVDSMSRPVGLGAARHVFGSGKPIHVPDYPNYTYAFPPFVKLGLDSGLAVPPQGPWAAASRTAGNVPSPRTAACGSAGGLRP